MLIFYLHFCLPLLHFCSCIWMCSLYNHACDHWNWWNYCEVWNSILNLFSLFPSVCSVPSVLFCFILSTIAAPHSHKGTPRLELNNCSFIVRIFSLRKIKRYGKDLQLSFRLAIIGRIFGMPAPIMLHHTLTQSLSQYWVNESHYSWEALYSFCGPASSIHVSVHRTGLWVEGRPPFTVKSP